ncbi:hypothetical protein [Novosphingobium sp. PhB55]|uniref:hypothetical protein n=1 Tax=Novosphingobium sp. PhB55 TaxID=2485106 RepID=UPI001065E6D8|nr:hypothetical protein [Novosphingobium sp. PhB55]
MRALGLVPGVYPMRADQCPVLALGTEPAHPLKVETVMKREYRPGLLAQWREICREAREAGEPSFVAGLAIVLLGAAAWAALYVMLPGEWIAL